MIRTIIIDDEINSIRSLELIIKEYCPELKLVSTCSQYSEAVSCILKHKPDLLLLDIEMPFGSGFDLLESLPEKNFGLIFITAYNHYAIRAFKYSAVDYLLKPVSIIDFCESISRFMKWHEGCTPDLKILLDNIRGPVPTKLAIPTAEGYEYLYIPEIVRIHAEGRYSRIFLLNLKNILVTKNIGEFDDLLQENNFCRVHNSYLINIHHVKKFSRIDGGIVEMVDSTKIPVARYRKNEFLQKMESISK